MSVRKSRSVKKKKVAVFFTLRGSVESVVLDTQKIDTGKWGTKKFQPKVVGG